MEEQVDRKKETQADVAGEPLIKWISIAARYGRMYLDREFDQYGINSSQHMLIKKLCKKQGMKQEELYSSVYVNKSNIARALKQLEEGGFVTRRKDEQDKRVIRVYPTEKARELYPKIVEIQAKWEAELKSMLSQEDLAQFGSTMKQIGLAAVQLWDNK